MLLQAANSAHGYQWQRQIMVNVACFALGKNLSTRTVPFYDDHYLTLPLVTMTTCLRLYPHSTLYELAISDHDDVIKPLPHSASCDFAISNHDDMIKPLPDSTSCDFAISNHDDVIKPLLTQHHVTLPSVTMTM